MIRLRISAIVLLSAAALIIVGCGGGGGGGGAVSINLTGRVIDSHLGAVDGVTVSASTGSTRAVISDVTEQGGWYTLANVPLGTSLTLTIAGPGISQTTFNNLSLDAVGSGATGYMDFFLTATYPPAGSTIRIAPAITRVTAGGTDLYAQVNSSYYTYATWLVVGDAYGHISSDDWRKFEVAALRNGQAKITTLVRLSDGTLGKHSLTVTTDMEGVELPPGPLD